MRSFDFLAPFYDRFERPPAGNRLQALLGFEPGKTLLDLGGGTGRVTQQFLGVAGRVVVCDVSLGMLRQSLRKPGLVPVCAESEHLPLPTESIDAILVVDALHHFQNQEKALAEAVRVLRTGGRILIEEPDVRRFWGRFTAAAERCVGFHSRFLAPADIRAYLASLGTDARIVEEGGFRVRLLGEKKAVMATRNHHGPD